MTAVTPPRVETQEESDLLDRLDPDHDPTDPCRWPVGTSARCGEPAAAEAVCRACGWRRGVCDRHAVTLRTCFATLPPSDTLGCTGCGRAVRCCDADSLFELRRIGARP